MATSGADLTEEEITSLGKDNYLGALELLDKYDIPSDDAEDVEQAMTMLWTVLGEHQSSQPLYKPAFDDAVQYSQGVLKNILNDNKETRKKLLENLESLMEFIGKLPAQCLKCLDEVCPNHKAKLEEIRSQLVNKQDCVLLVVGETSSGKSSILNLLLGHMNNDFLPISHLSSTSVICELKYGKEKRMIVHRRDDAEPPLVIDLPDDAGNVISEHTHQKGLRDTTFENKRVEIFWPLDWLEDGITLVDTPGIGEDKDLTQLVEEAMKISFGVIYVVNTTNAGGIVSDRLDTLLEAHAHAWKQGDAGTFNPATAIFICNKWDRVKEEDKKIVQDHVINELADRGFTRNQVYFLSCKTAMTQLQKGFMSQTSDLKVLMQGIQSVVPAGLKFKLQQQYSYIVKVLDRIQNVLSAYSTEYTDEKLASIKRAEKNIDNLEKEVQTLKTTSKILLEEKYKDVVKKLKEHLLSPVVKERITTWERKDCPVGDYRKELKREMMMFVMQRIQKEMIAWEKETQCFANTHKELLAAFQQQYSIIMSKNYKLEVKMFGNRARNHHVEQIPEDDVELTLGGKVMMGLTSPLWVPLGIVIGIICVPVVIGWAFFEIFGADILLKNIEQEMSKMSLKVLDKVHKTDLIEQQLVPVQEQLLNIMSQVVDEVIDHLNANKILLKKQGSREMINVLLMNVDLGALSSVRKQVRNQLEIAYLTSIKVYHVNSKDITMEEKIGEGNFADVFIGKWNKKTVAIKRVKSQLSPSNADMITREEANLWALQNPNVVQFYGCCCENTESGVHVLFVMEYCYTTLSKYIYPDGPGTSKYTCPSKCTKGSPAYADSSSGAADFATQIARGLDAIHQLGHVHRDLKPDNILVTVNHILKICDLGLAKDVAEIRGTICGTILYMAPEVMEGEIYSQKADMFGYGMIMWELWYGQCVISKYQVKNMKEFLSAPYIPSEVRPDATYDQIMKGCWKMDPDERLSAENCEEMLRQQYFAEESQVVVVAKKAGCVVQ